jgi:hypothetical protein
MRIGTRGMPLLIARSTSRSICGEVLQWPENTRTMTREAAIAARIELAQVVPGKMSRGAIQHRMPFCSSIAQVASAIGLSLDEWLMNTSCAILEP